MGITRQYNRKLTVKLMQKFGAMVLSVALLTMVGVFLFPLVLPVTNLCVNAGGNIYVTTSAAPIGSSGRTGFQQNFRNGDSKFQKDHPEFRMDLQTYAGSYTITDYNVYDFLKAAFKKIQP